MKNKKSFFIKWWETASVLDLRSIALFRIVLGIVLLMDLLWWKLPYIRACYLADSVFSLEFHKDTFSWHGWSLLNYCYSDISVYLFWSLAAFVYVLFLLGWKTKFIAPVAYLFLFSLQQRQPYLQFGWDHYLHVLLFWGMFLPLNKRWSVEAHKYTHICNEYQSIACFAILLQIALLYFVSGMAKNGNLWMDGQGVKTILLDLMLRQAPQAEWLYLKDGLNSCFNYLTLVFEIGLVFLIFFPLGNKYSRLLSAVSIVGFHWGLSIFLNVGGFRWVALVSASLLMPAFLWSRLKKPRVLINGELHLLQAPKWHSIVLIWLLMFLVLKNLNNLKKRGHLSNAIQYWETKDILEKVSHLRLFKISPFEQNWLFYAPNPPSELGHIVLTAYTPNDTLNVYENSSISDSHFPNPYYEGPLFFWVAAFRIETKEQLWLLYCQELLKWEAQKIKKVGKIKDIEKLEIGLFSFNLDNLKIGNQHSLQYIPIMDINLKK